MLFRLRMSLYDPLFGDEPAQEPLRTSNCEVTITRDADTDTRRWIVSATTERMLSEQLAEMFEGLLQGRLPRGVKVKTPLFEAPWPAGTFDVRHHLPLSPFPDEFRAAVEDARADSHAACMEVASVYRWRHGLDTTLPFGFLDWMWSSDGISWSHAPSDTFAHAYVETNTLELTEPRLVELQTLLDQPSRPSVAHELIQEAKKLPTRSRIILSVSGIEVGIKSLIAILVPDARWLALRIPSPPINDMLKNYVPLLPIRNRPAASPPIPRYLRDKVQALVKARDALIHRGTIDDKDGAYLMAMTRYSTLAAEDLLYLFDFYAGVTWAADNFSPDLSDALSLPWRGKAGVGYRDEG